MQIVSEKSIIWDIARVLPYLLNQVLFNGNFRMTIYSEQGNNIPLSSTEHYNLLQKVLFKFHRSLRN